jgi:hypothetical protein
MPQAKTLTMCPQCGCTEITSNTTNPSAGGKVTFTCGETTGLAQDGAYLSGYTCRTIPDSMRFCEQAMFYARKTVDGLSVSVEVLKMLMNLSKATGYVQMSTHGQRSRARQLVAKGFAVYAQDADDVVSITAWGMFAANILKGRLT